MLAPRFEVLRGEQVKSVRNRIHQLMHLDTAIGLVLLLALPAKAVRADSAANQQRPVNIGKLTILCNCFGDGVRVPFQYLPVVAGAVLFVRTNEQYRPTNEHDHPTEDCAARIGASACAVVRD